MQKLNCLLFVLKQSYICCYIICMTVPLIEKENITHKFSKADYQREKISSYHYTIMVFVLLVELKSIPDSYN